VSAVWNDYHYSELGASLVPVRGKQAGRLTARFRNFSFVGAFSINQSENRRQNTEVEEMLRWALGFFIVALIAAGLDFTGLWCGRRNC